MSIRKYLPSSQFISIVGSIALSAVIVMVAYAATSPKPSGSLSTPTNTEAQGADWQKALAQIQAQSGVASLPEPVSQDSVDRLLGAAQSSNVTATIARSLLINLSNAKSQGLGDDIPTQEKLIADATAQAQLNNSKKAVYTTADLNIVPQNKDSLRIYGNASMKAFNDHPKASAQTTMYAVAYATDYNDVSRLAAFPSIQSAYEDLADTLVSIPVPTALAPLHLKVVNNLAAMAATYPDMQATMEDPLRGLAGISLYQSLGTETSRVFTNIAQELQRDGILFSKDEPGSAWSAFLSLP